MAEGGQGNESNPGAGSSGANEKPGEFEQDEIDFGKTQEVPAVPPPNDPLAADRAQYPSAPDWVKAARDAAASDQTPPGPQPTQPGPTKPDYSGGMGGDKNATYGRGGLPKPGASGPTPYVPHPGVDPVTPDQATRLPQDRPDHPPEDPQTLLGPDLIVPDLKEAPKPGNPTEQGKGKPINN